MTYFKFSRSDLFAFAFVAAIAALSLLLIKHFAPFIPDYDGLVYFDFGKSINGWLFNARETGIVVPEAVALVGLLPITNAHGVLGAALLRDVVDLNTIPIVVHGACLLAFLLYISRVRSITYAVSATALLCGHLFFFRLFTTLTSEFVVGLWIFAFLLTLSSDSKHQFWRLTVLTVAGIFIRTVDVVFILSATAAFGFGKLFIQRDSAAAKRVLKPIAIAIVLTLPLFFKHYVVTFNYIYEASFGATAAAWKELSGVSNRFDVIRRYGIYLYMYNPLIMAMLIVTMPLAVFFARTSRKQFALLCLTTLALLTPLFLASSLNVQVVFWPFAAIVLTVCESTALVYMANCERWSRHVLPIRRWAPSFFAAVVVVYLAVMLTKSWKYEVPNLAQQKITTNASTELSGWMNMEPGNPLIASNFRGVGSLDVLGLSLARDSNFRYSGMEDVFSKKLMPSEYVQAAKGVNFFIAAHENYYFPVSLGINAQIKATFKAFLEQSQAMGFKKLPLSPLNATKFSLWYRPTAHPMLQFAAYSDNWIAGSMPIRWPA